MPIISNCQLSNSLLYRLLSWTMAKKRTSGEIWPSKEIRNDSILLYKTRKRCDPASEYDTHKICFKSCSILWKYLFCTSCIGWNSSFSSLFEYNRGNDLVFFINCSQCFHDALYSEKVIPLYVVALGVHSLKSARWQSKRDFQEREQLSM